MKPIISERQFYAETHDVCMSDWPGEIGFYREVLANQAKSINGTILDIACGTGRIGLRLAKSGVFVVGLDRSPEMLAVARQKSEDIKNVRWVEVDMRSFELKESFDLVLIPSHSFQNLNTPEDQFACKTIWKLSLSNEG